MGEIDFTVASPVSQFITLDLEGTIIIWSTQTLSNNNINENYNTSYEDYMKEIKNNTNNNINIYNNNDKIDNNKIKNGNNGNKDLSVPLSTCDFGLSPTGKIILIQTKVIKKNINMNRQIFGSINKNEKEITGVSSHNSFNDFQNVSKTKSNETKTDSSQNSLNLSTKSVLSPLPNDISTFLLSGNHGKVAKIVRFGEPTCPKEFLRPEDSKMEFSVSSSSSSKR